MLTADQVWSLLEREAVVRRTFNSLLRDHSYELAPSATPLSLLITRRESIGS